MNFHITNFNPVTGETNGSYVVGVESDFKGLAEILVFSDKISDPPSKKDFENLLGVGVYNFRAFGEGGVPENYGLKDPIFIGEFNPVWVYMREKINER